MADIKTRDTVKGTIKAIDKSVVAAERMKDAFIRTKDETQRGNSPAEDSPEAPPTTMQSASFIFSINFSICFS